MDSKLVSMYRLNEFWPEKYVKRDTFGELRKNYTIYYNM